MRTSIFRGLAAVALLLALAQGQAASAFGQEAPSIEACPQGQVGAVVRWSDGRTDVACVTAPSQVRSTQGISTSMSTSTSSSISTSVSKSTTCVNGSCTSVETTSTCVDGSCSNDQVVDDDQSAATD